MRNPFKTFRKNEDGATAIEYGLIAALIAIAIIGAARTLGSSLNTKFTDINTELNKSASSTSSTSTGG